MGDIRTAIPQGDFDKIIWDGAIEHFTEQEITPLMGTIKSRLTPDGILSEYTIIEPEHGSKQLHQHEYEFHDKADLARFLGQWFKSVQVLQTNHPERQNLYFWASDAALPMERDLVLRTTSTD